MPVGDFPTVFPTIMTFRLNRMVTSKNGIIQQMTLHFSYILLIIIDYVCFADHKYVFLGEYLHIPHMYIYNTMLYFSLYHDIVYCSWKNLFAIYMHILHVCSTWKTQDGRKCIKNFVVLGCFRGFRTKLIGLECPSGIFPRYSPR